MYYVYSLSDDEVLGPYSLIDLVTFIKPGILVCEENNENWQNAEEIPAIAELFVELGLTQPKMPEGYIINEFGESVKITDEPPVGIRVNSSGEIIRNNTHPTTNNNSRNVIIEEKKNYTGWIIFGIIVILIIIAASGGFE
jgi:hypothetical protein